MRTSKFSLALESDAELFDEVLEPLQTLTIDSKRLDSGTTCDGMDFDDDSLIKVAALLDLCEEVFSMFSSQQQLQMLDFVF